MASLHTAEQWLAELSEHNALLHVCRWSRGSSGVDHVQASSSLSSWDVPLDCQMWRQQLSS
jgi:hypothetical protein